MKTFILPLLCTLALCDSDAQVPEPRPPVPSDAPAVVFTDCRRPGDAVFSQREQEIIAAARHHLEQDDKRPLDAYYRVKHVKNGFEVFVIHVSGYTGSQPSFVPGGHCTVLLREDGSVIKVRGGA